MTTPVPDRRPSSNAFGRHRDAQVLWLLERHPATAAMLWEIGLFPTTKKASKRLRRLFQKKQMHLLGTVSLKDGRPEHVYGRGRWKTDNLQHEVQITRLCLRIQAEEIRRGAAEVDRYVRPDVELWINGKRLCLEMDLGTISYGEIVRKRFTKYRSCSDLVLWVCSSETRMEGLRRHADMIRATALFTTLDQALATPHGDIWTDCDGRRAALPSSTG